LFLTNKTVSRAICFDNVLTNQLPVEVLTFEIPSFLKMSAADYQVLSDTEHVLRRPGMYIGSCANIEEERFIADVEEGESPKIVRKSIIFNAGLARIFEEILLNAFDHTIRDATCSEIRVDVDPIEHSITVTNNGTGIPVVKKPELDIYIPEMLFGMLRSGSNFDETKKRIVGGQNGLGGSLCVLFSREFTIETVDAERKKWYQQTWKANMSTKSAPEIKACRKKPYTRVCFKPDLKYFHLVEDLPFSDDFVMLLKKRIIDIGYVSKPSVKTFFNGKLISIKKPEDYMKLYANPTNEKFLVDDTNERWSVGVVLSNDGFHHASFVNGIHTSLGGSHVDHVVSQVVKAIIEKLKTKKIDVKPSDVKNRLFVFVKSAIVNPVFDSQTKECLKMPKSSFGSEYVMSDSFRLKLLRSSVYDCMTAVSDAKKLKDLEKTSGSKQVRLTDIEMLEDATFAGTSKAHTTKLILTEGLSARTFAMSALNVIGRERYGIFPLKGKPLNVRDAPRDAVAKNEEIRNMAKALGLKYTLTYETDADVKSLRYGGIIALCDSDTDGYHITGLLINYVHNFWPALITRGFVSFCITPIVKVYKGKDILPFYTLTSYDDWLKTATGAYRTKYFKGLGTSTAAEAREALANIDQKLINFERDENCDESVSLLFSKSRADERKTWLMERYDPKSSIDRDNRTVGVSDFINLEVCHFSKDDNDRSIPSIMDGLKPSQRKILYIAFKHAVNTEMKVAQLGPLVSQKADYHHGEQSLMGAIIKLAQNYVGANNINLLLPLGAFGTRLANGADAASPRYIFTRVNPVALKLFDPRDNVLLNHLKIDGTPIEPEWFAPVLPVVLINGSIGIGTGFSTTIPQYNPVDLAGYIKAMLQGEEASKTLRPWYRDFKGEIQWLGDSSKYVTFGVWTFIDRSRCLHITELPIGVATDAYTKLCRKLLEKENSPLDDVKYGNTDTVVDFQIIFKPAEYAKYKSMSREKIVADFHLSSSFSTSNMHMFNSEGRMSLYPDVYTIIDYYYAKRLELYYKRKVALEHELNYRMLILNNKAKFIAAVKEGKIEQRNMTEASLLAVLQKDFDPDTRSSGGAYEYLLSMSYRSFAKENKEKMLAAVEVAQQELDTLQSTTPESMWMHDIDATISMLIRP
jgi:DNA topoisomerase-2